jgi:hypothetical protein
MSAVTEMLCLCAADHILVKPVVKIVKPLHIYFEPLRVLARAHEQPTSGIFDVHGEHRNVTLIKMFEGIANAILFIEKLGSTEFQVGCTA